MEDYRVVEIDASVEAGALLVADLLKLFSIMDITEDAGLYICDPTDPDKRFIIRSVASCDRLAELEAIADAVEVLDKEVIK